MCNDIGRNNYLVKLIQWQLNQVDLVYTEYLPGKFQ